MDSAAMLTCASLLISVKRRIERRQVIDDTFEIDFDTMHQIQTIKTIPLECIQPTFRTLRLNNKSNRSFLRSLRRVAHVRRQQKNFALPDWHVVMLPTVYDLKHHVALELVKEFLHRIVMKIRFAGWGRRRP